MSSSFIHFAVYLEKKLLKKRDENVAQNIISDLMPPHSSLLSHLEAKYGLGEGRMYSNLISFVHGDGEFTCRAKKILIRVGKNSA